MAHRHEQPGPYGEGRRHRHGPPEGNAPRKRVSLRPWFRGERDWLDQSWKAAEDFLACNKCVPNLTDSEREKLRWRWLKEAQHYDRLWRERRRRDYALRVPIVIGAATVPVLAGLDAGRLPTALVGLAVAILAGLDGLFQLRERSSQLRETATVMTHEGWCFLELTGHYFDEASHKNAYRRFLDRLEAINATQTERYLRVFEEPRRDEKSAEPPVRSGA
jgi:hypothetical protein